MKERFSSYNSYFKSKFKTDLSLFSIMNINIVDHDMHNPLAKILPWVVLILEGKDDTIFPCDFLFSMFPLLITPFQINSYLFYMLIASSLLQLKGHFFL